MHLKRWITSIAAIPILFGLIYRGDSAVFAVFLCVVCLIALREYFCIVLKPAPVAPAGYIPLWGFISGPLIIWSAFRNAFGLTLCLLAINLMVAGLLSLREFKSDPSVVRVVFKQVLGSVYIPLLLSFLVILRRDANGVLWIFFLICVVFAGDTGAYYVGSYLGRHKLCPSVSPGKTIEGAVGGLAANIIAGALFKDALMPASSWAICIFFFVAMGLAGQIGDLFESALKRRANIKDSGAILPGHGGVLDRIDALLFAAPVAFLFVEYIL